MVQYAKCPKCRHAAPVTKTGRLKEHSWTGAFHEGDNRALKQGRCHGSGTHVPTKNTTKR